MQVHYDEGVANHIGPEPCVGARERAGEASAKRRRSVGEASAGEIALARVGRVGCPRDAVRLSTYGLRAGLQRGQRSTLATVGRFGGEACQPIVFYFNG